MSIRPKHCANEARGLMSRLFSAMYEKGKYSLFPLAVVPLVMYGTPDPDPQENREIKLRITNACVSLRDGRFALENLEKSATTHSAWLEVVKRTNKVAEQQLNCN